MIEAGLRHVDVIEPLCVSRGTITRLAARYRVRGTVDDLPRSGRPRVTTPVQDRHIRTSHLHGGQLEEFLRLEWEAIHSREV